MCDVDEEAVVTAADAPSIYDIPKVLHREGLDAYVVRRLDLPFRDVDWTVWDDLLRRVHHPKEEVTRRAGRQVHRPARRLPLGRPRRCAPAASRTRPRSSCTGSPPTSAPPRPAPRGTSRDVDAICVPGGFGIRGIEGKLGALTYARTHGIPTLGLCLGLQCMVIEYARSVAGLEKAASTEFDPDAPEPVIATMEEQKSFVEGAGDLGGTMRLGLYPAALKEGSVVREAYGEALIEERHRHRYEVNNPYRDQLEARRPGVLRHLAGQQPGRVRRAAPRGAPVLRLHPGAPRAALAARPGPHPLFAGLVGAAIERQRELRFPIDESGLRRKDDAED